MSTIPLPALDLHQQPQPDILGQFGKLQALRSLGQQTQMQQGQLQIQQQQIADQQATTAALRAVDPTDPKYKDNPLQYYADVQQNVLKNNGSANAALAVQQHGLTVQKTVSDIAKQDAETGSKKLETYITQHKALGDQIEGLLNLPDEQLHDGAIAKINGAVGTLLDAPTAQQYIQQIQGISDPKQLRTTIDTIGKAALGATNVANLAKTQAETAEQTASANAKRQESDFYNRSGVGAPGVPAEVVQMSDWLRQNPGKTPSDYAAAKAGMVAAAEQPYKIETARVEGEARANIEHQMAVQGQAALANVPTHLVGPATEKAIAAGTEYAQAKAVTDRLAAMMDAAKKGNVVSYQLIPEEGALQVVTNQGIKRINMAEIQNYGGGSLWQRLQGHIGKALTGESIPDSVLQDMSDIQDIMAAGAQTKYENTLKTINQATGAQFKPVEMDTMKAPQKATGNVAPEGTRIQVGNQIQVKKNGKWVPEQQ
jgi:hypothetical protein